MYDVLGLTLKNVSMLQKNDQCWVNRTSPSNDKQNLGGLKYGLSLLFHIQCIATLMIGDHALGYFEHHMGDDETCLGAVIAQRNQVTCYDVIVSMCG